MVNMYSMGGMYGTGSSGNVYQNIKNKYGVGKIDAQTTPYIKEYPMGIIAKRPEASVDRNWLGRFIKRCFLN